MSSTILPTRVAACNGKAKPVALWSTPSDFFHNALLRFCLFLCLHLYPVTNGVYRFKYNYSYFSPSYLSILNCIFDSRPLISLSVNFFCLPVPDFFNTLISLDYLAIISSLSKCRNHFNAFSLIFHLLPLNSLLYVDY